MPAPLPARACPPRATRDRPGSAACPASTVSCYRNQCLDFPQGKAPASLSPRRPHCTLQGGHVAGDRQTRERRPVPHGLTKRAGKMPFSDGAVSCQGDLRRGLT